MGVMYGYQISPRDDPFIAVAQKSADVVIESTLPGAYLVNIFPSRGYLLSWPFPTADAFALFSPSSAGMVSWCWVQSPCEAR
jgi:hypothetical protein